MIGALTVFIGKSGLPEEILRPIAWLIVVIVTLSIAIPLLLWAKSSYDSSIIENAANKANTEFLEELDEATGRADTLSDESKAQINVEIKQTEELIDEAIEKGCAVPEYIGSNGADCVSSNAATIPNTGT